MLKLGIIGCGRLGSFHADKAAAHPQVQLVGVFDPVVSSREAAAHKHGVKAFEDIEAMVPEVDAVVVATPTVTHHAVGMQCLHRGLHVLMEKPIAVSRREAVELVAAAGENLRILQVGHVERFNPAWKSAITVTDEIVCGERALFEAVRTSGYTFRSTDIGTVLDMMIHDLDLVLSVETSPVVSVDAIGFHVVDPSRMFGHEDTVQARLVFENGSVASLFSSRVARESVRRMNITLPKQTAVIDFGSRTTQIIRPGGNVLAGDFSPHVIDARRIASVAPGFMQECFSVQEFENAAVDALALELDDFVNAVLQRREPIVTGRQALRAVEAAEMILAAIRLPKNRFQQRAA
ncbi:MAG TPA: gfo/Idh/MocA family oxidoreductase [Planctomycetaceae bacterium]|nr:gfo/Idh/MocA family oxidoreductase [Planctomycetaceae bacterium]